MLITESLKIDNKDILTKGEIYNAPYFILHIAYDRLNTWKNLLTCFNNASRSEQAREMIDTIDRLKMR